MVRDRRVKCGRTFQAEGTAYAEEPRCYWVGPEVLNLGCTGFGWSVKLLKLNAKRFGVVPAGIFFVGEMVRGFHYMHKGFVFLQKGQEPMLVVMKWHVSGF